MQIKIGVFIAIAVFVSASPALTAQAKSNQAKNSDSNTVTHTLAINTDDSTPPPAHPATVEQIHEYWALKHTMDSVNKVRDTMIRGMRATSAPYFTASFWDDFEKSFRDLDLDKAFIPAYQRYFSQEDMADVIAFYKSSAGQRLIKAEPQINAFASAILKEQGKQIGLDVYARHKVEIEAAKKQYESHSSATPSSSTNSK